MFAIVMLLMGAFFMYLLDPVSGQRRRDYLWRTMGAGQASVNVHRTDGEPRDVIHSEAERRQREAEIDAALEASFPASDPPSSSPLKPDNEGSVTPPGQASSR